MLVEIKYYVPSLGHNVYYESSKYSMISSFLTKTYKIFTKTLRGRRRYILKPKPKRIHLRIDIDEESRKKILYIRDILGFKLYKRDLKDDRAGTVIKLLLFEQINLYKKDKKKFEANWKERKENLITKKKMNGPRDISIRFPSKTINDIEKLKMELHYQESRKEFMYELIQEGVEYFLKEIKESLNISKLDKKTIDEAHEYFPFLCEEFQERDETYKNKGKEIAVYKDDIYRWELMREALSRIINRGYYIAHEVI